MDENIVICRVNYNNCEEAINYSWIKKYKESSMNLLNDERMFKNMSKYNIFDYTEIWYAAYKNNEIIGTISIQKDKIIFVYSDEEKTKLQLIKTALCYITMEGYNEAIIESTYDINETFEYKKIKNEKINIYELRR